MSLSRLAVAMVAVEAKVEEARQALAALQNEVQRQRYGGGGYAAPMQAVQAMRQLLSFEAFDTGAFMTACVDAMRAEGAVK